MTVLSSERKDILSFIIKLSTEEAASALSEMTSNQVTLEVPEVDLVSLNNLINRMGGADKPVNCIYLAFEGDVFGLIAIVLSTESSYKLIDALMGEEIGTTSEMDDMGRSALGEVGNVVVTYFLRILGEHTWLNIVPSVPDVLTDMAGAILSSMVLSIGEEPDEVLFVRAIFKAEEHNIESNMFLFASPEVLKKIIDTLEVKQ
ncbi:MAG: chemotaxis protein CheC [Actinomycetota bacterium]|nr:chemotaxis protein CheC [Actinomycetota bacterium]